MTRPVVTVPLSLLRAAEIYWDIDVRGSPPGEATSGFSQTVYSAFPRWIGRLSLIHKRAFIGHWRALRWSAEGRAGIWRIPMVDPAMLNRAAAFGFDAARTGIPFSTGQVFSNGFGFLADQQVDAAAAAAVGATSIILTITDAALVPVPGQIISASDWPMGVVSVEEMGADLYTVGVRMPLRAAIASGDKIKLLGEGLFEVLDDLAGAGSYGLVHASTPSISFREVLNR